mmetsp:Transcript_30822/g.74463  ORF Transcript_30822/g.74463 Transcript_30822/m.74463 type:complete len:321 (-) Transcript_30822:787-1749(-)
MARQLVRSSPEHPTCSRQTTSNAFGTLRQFRLFEWNAQCLCRDRGGCSVILALLASTLQALLAALILHPLFPVLVLAPAPWSQYEIVQFKVGNKVLPLRNLYQMIIAVFPSLFEHAILNLDQLLLHHLRQLVHTNIDLLPPEPNHHPSLALLQITRPDLYTNRHALLLPVRVLPPRIVYHPVVELAPHVLLLEGPFNALAVRREVLEGTLLANDGNDHGLEGRDPGGKYQSGIIAVDHDHHADRSRGQSPASLPRHLRLPLLVLIINVEHLTEVLSEVMTRRPLDRPPGSGDVPLHGSRRVSPRELLLLGLVPRHHRHCK